ncbi:MAG: hypothetical protein AAGB02_05650 [Pseudomonadota bacterium]
MSQKRRGFLEPFRRKLYLATFLATLAGGFFVRDSLVAGTKELGEMIKDGVVWETTTETTNIAPVEESLPQPTPHITREFVRRTGYFGLAPRDKDKPAQLFESLEVGQLMCWETLVQVIYDAPLTNISANGVLADANMVHKIGVVCVERSESVAIPTGIHVSQDLLIANIDNLPVQYFPDGPVPRLKPGR